MRAKLTRAQEYDGKKLKPGTEVGDGTAHDHIPPAQISKWLMRDDAKPVATAALNAKAEGNGDKKAET